MTARTRTNSTRTNRNATTKGDTVNDTNSTKSTDLAPAGTIPAQTEDKIITGKVNRFRSLYQSAREQMEQSGELARTAGSAVVEIVAAEAYEDAGDFEDAGELFADLLGGSNGDGLTFPRVVRDQLIPLLSDQGYKQTPIAGMLNTSQKTVSNVLSDGKNVDSNESKRAALAAATEEKDDTGEITAEDLANVAGDLEFLKSAVAELSTPDLSALFDAVKAELTSRLS